ncbi:hypothetical protein, partial [Actinacidiphila glaucinigra]|uniref:hypothetical protein n=1 Tax=Actinacidiphila glaucinigra TaxID=235986 RepID=UPI0035DB60CF
QKAVTRALVSRWIEPRHIKHWTEKDWGTVAEASRSGEAFAAAVIKRIVADHDLIAGLDVFADYREALNLAWFNKSFGGKNAEAPFRFMQAADRLRHGGIDILSLEWAILSVREQAQIKTLVRDSLGSLRSTVVDWTAREWGAVAVAHEHAGQAAALATAKRQARSPQPGQKRPGGGLHVWTMQADSNTANLNKTILEHALKDPTAGPGTPEHRQRLQNALNSYGPTPAATRRPAADGQGPLPAVGSDNDTPDTPGEDTAASTARTQAQSPALASWGVPLPATGDLNRRLLIQDDLSQRANVVPVDNDHLKRDILEQELASLYPDAEQSARVRAALDTHDHSRRTHDAAETSHHTSTAEGGQGGPTTTADQVVAALTGLSTPDARNGERREDRVPAEDVPHDVQASDVVGEGRSAEQASGGHPAFAPVYAPKQPVPVPAAEWTPEQTPASGPTPYTTSQHVTGRQGVWRELEVDEWLVLRVESELKRQGDVKVSRDELRGEVEMWRQRAAEVDAAAGFDVPDRLLAERIAVAVRTGEIPGRFGLRGGMYGGGGQGYGGGGWSGESLLLGPLAQAESLVGKLRWRGALRIDPDSGLPQFRTTWNHTNDFATWIRGGSEPTSESTMNCWDAIIFSAYRAKAITFDDIKKIYFEAAQAYRTSGPSDDRDELERRSDYYTSLMRSLYVGKLVDYRINRITRVGVTAVHAGFLVFFGDMRHVVISTGTRDNMNRQQVLSLWVEPEHIPAGAVSMEATYGPMQKTSIEELAASDALRGCTIRFGLPIWADSRV